MSRGKSTTLLTIIGVVLAVLIALTFATFPVGEVSEYTSALGAIELDYDLEGGKAYTLKLSEENEEEVTDVNQVLDTLEYRLTALGYSAYSVKAVKSTDPAVLDYDIRIEVKETETVDSDIEVVAAFGEVAFYGGTSANPTEQILEGEKVVESANYLGAVTSGTTTAYQMTIKFTDDAYAYIINAIEAAEVDGGSYYLEVKLGDQVLLSGSSAITASSFYNRLLYITSQNEAGAKQMALQVTSGGLAYQYEIDSVEDISSPYGEGVATKCAIAIGVLFLVLMVAIIVIYKGFGWISALSTLAFMLLEIWMLIAVPGIVLSLGGVVGIAAALLLAVYSMIITADRIKEEYSHSEKTVKAAINRGFQQSLVPVISVNVVVGIIAIALLAFTSGTVKCFAITLGIGAVISLISALLFTRMFTSLIMPLVKNKEKFLNMKKVEA